MGQKTIGALSLGSSSHVRIDRRWRRRTGIRWGVRVQTEGEEGVQLGRNVVRREMSRAARRFRRFEGEGTLSPCSMANGLPAAERPGSHEPEIVRLLERTRTTGATDAGWLARWGAAVPRIASGRWRGCKIRAGGL